MIKNLNIKKQLLTLFAITTVSIAYGQVGINTTTPGSTLDITAKASTGTTTTVDGLMVPRVDRQRAQSMTGIPTSTLIYVNSATTGTQTGSAANIDDVGYYYFDGSTWVKLNSGGTNTNIYNADGSLTSNRVVNQGGNTLAFTSTVNNGFSVDGSTFSVDGANDRIGIGTTTPSQKLDVVGNARISGSTGTPITITGRDSSGNIGNVNIGTGISLSGGTLSATAVPISNIVYPFLNIQPVVTGTYTLDSVAAPNYTLWVSAPLAASQCSINLPNPNTMVGRTMMIIAAGGETKLCVPTGHAISAGNGDNTQLVPSYKRVTLQASGNFGGMWAIISKDF